VLLPGTENARVCREFLEGLLKRGFKINEGILCVVDGSKGLIKGIKKAFGKKQLKKRRHWHKRENVVSYLPKEKQDIFRKKLNEVFNKPSYEEARAVIQVVREKLKVINERTVRSLDERIEKILTLHRLGVFENWRGVLRVQIV